MTENIPLTPDEVHTGLWYEKELAAAKATLDALTIAQNIYVNHLIRTYGAPGVRYQLRDWFAGIEVAQEQPNG